MADNVVDLGQFDAPRPNPLGEGIMAGAQGIAQGMQNKQQLNVALAKVASQKQATTNRLQIALAKQQEEEDKTHHDNTVKALEQTSLYLADKNPQEQAMFKTTPHYKEIMKLAQKYAPEYVDTDNKQLVFPEPKEIYTDALNKQKFQLQQKMQSGAKLSDGEQKLADFLQKTDTSLVGSALHAATQDPSFKADPKGTMQQYVQAAIQGKQQMQQSKQDQTQAPTQSPNPISTAIAGDQQTNPNDPLGILKYLKPGSNN